MLFLQTKCPIKVHRQQLNSKKRSPLGSYFRCRCCCFWRKWQQQKVESTQFAYHIINGFVWWFIPICIVIRDWRKYLWANDCIADCRHEYVTSFFHSFFSLFSSFFSFASLSKGSVQRVTNSNLLTNVTKEINRKGKYESSVCGICCVTMNFTVSQPQK